MHGGQFPPLFLALHKNWKRIASLVKYTYTGTFHSRDLASTLLWIHGCLTCARMSIIQAGCASSSVALADPGVCWVRTRPLALDVPSSRGCTVSFATAPQYRSYSTYVHSHW